VKHVLGFIAVCAGAELGSAIAALAVGLSQRRISEDNGPSAWRAAGASPLSNPQALDLSLEDTPGSGEAPGV